jgi:hypothetical protein
MTERPLINRQSFVLRREHALPGAIAGEDSRRHAVRSGFLDWLRCHDGARGSAQHGSYSGGTTVLVGVVPITEMVPISAADLTLQEKKIRGSYMGSNRFRFDMPKYIEFYLDGRLRLDEMISSRIKLEEVNDAFDRMRKGEAARQVIVFD